MSTERGKNSEWDWYAGDVVCVAVVPRDQPVDWSPGTYNPTEQVWLPEAVFNWLLEQLENRGLQLVPRERVHLQARLSPEFCIGLLAVWDGIEDVAELTPAHGWVVAVRLILQRIVGSTENVQLLVEGP